jgi:hypothetical protein
MIFLMQDQSLKALLQKGVYAKVDLQLVFGRWVWSASDRVGQSIGSMLE